MLVSDALGMLRRRINDKYETGYDTEVLINYLNDAVKYLSHAIIVRNDPILTKSLYIYSTKENEVPKNFVRFAGGYPIRRQGAYFFITNGSEVVRTKYFYIPDEVSAVTDHLPFEANDTYGALMVQVASIYALNQHEFNVERDTAMKSELEKLVVAALGAVE